MEEGFGVGALEEGFGRPIVDVVEKARVFEGEFDFVAFGKGGGSIRVRRTKVDRLFEFKFVEFAAALFFEIKFVATGFAALEDDDEGRWESSEL